MPQSSASTQAQAQSQAPPRTIAGNAPQQIKDLLSDLITFFGMNLLKPGSVPGLPTSSASSDSLTSLTPEPVLDYVPIFGDSIVKRLMTTEVSINQKAEEPKKLEGRVVCEITVDEDMINGAGNVHGGCLAFLIDACSTLSLTALRASQTGVPFYGVSQSLNIVYHSPAGMGEKLRLVNTTMTAGARAVSARTEVWNDTHHRLVASGVHIKMEPSEPKANL
ncbi:hypothetical protein AX16_008451 [Volvariella volvacea WC 439]|nr:hypothetical protein AX16_008451 [Volvariella volvacea WC 439]